MKKTFLMAIYPYLLKQYNIMFETIQKKYQITQIEIDVLAFLAKPYNSKVPALIP